MEAGGEGDRAEPSPKARPPTGNVVALTEAGSPRPRPLTLPRECHPRLCLRKSLGCGTESKGPTSPQDRVPCFRLGDLHSRQLGQPSTAPTPLFTSPPALPSPCPTSRLPRLRYSLHNVGKGREQGLGLVLYAMLGTQGLHQGSHFVVIVSRHRGEKASGGTGQSVASTPLLPPLPTRAPSLRPGSPAPPYSLVLDLEVEVPAEPVIEGGLFHIARGCQLFGRRG